VTLNLGRLAATLEPPSTSPAHEIAATWIHARYHQSPSTTPSKTIHDATEINQLKSGSRQYGTSQSNTDTLGDGQEEEVLLHTTANSAHRRRRHETNSVHTHREHLRLTQHLCRFSPSTFSTLALSTRPASTSSRYIHTPPPPNRHPESHPLTYMPARPLCPAPAPSSWTSSAPAASPSPPSSRTPKPSLSAPAAPRSSASPPVARPVLPRAALSAGSRALATMMDLEEW
jgi:hypothetical protein